MATKQQTKYFTTTQGIKVNYTGLLPDDSPLPLALAMDKEDSTKIAKFPDGNGELNKSLLQDVEFYSYITKEEAQSLEFVEHNSRYFTIVNPIIAPDVSSLKKAPVVKLDF